MLWPRTRGRIGELPHTVEWARWLPGSRKTNSWFDIARRPIGKIEGQHIIQAQDRHQNGSASTLAIHPIVSWQWWGNVENGAKRFRNTGDVATMRDDLAQLQTDFPTLAAK